MHTLIKFSEQNMAKPIPECSCMQTIEIILGLIGAVLISFSSQEG